MGKIQWLLPFKPLEQVITPRGPFMVSLKWAMRDEPKVLFHMLKNPCFLGKNYEVLFRETLFH